MKRLLFLATIFVCISCTSYQEKNIYYELTAIELEKFLSEYPQNELLYEAIKKIRDSSSDIDKAKYEELTYKRILDCLEILTDTNYWYPIKDSLEMEWNKKYPENNPDSLKYDLNKLYFLRVEYDKVIKSKDELVYKLMMESRK